MKTFTFVQIIAKHTATNRVVHVVVGKERKKDCVQKIKQTNHEKVNMKVFIISLIFVLLIPVLIYLGISFVVWDFPAVYKPMVFFRMWLMFALGCAFIVYVVFPK